MKQAALATSGGGVSAGWPTSPDAVVAGASAAAARASVQRQEGRRCWLGLLGLRVRGARLPTRRRGSAAARRCCFGAVGPRPSSTPVTRRVRPLPSRAASASPAAASASARSGVCTGAYGDGWVVSLERGASRRTRRPAAPRLRVERVAQFCRSSAPFSYADSAAGDRVLPPRPPRRSTAGACHPIQPRVCRLLIRPFCRGHPILPLQRTRKLWHVLCY